jgi:hypothetical protein
MEDLATSRSRSGIWAPGTWSPDGEFFAYGELGGIMFLKAKDRKVTPFINTKAIEVQPEFSPDGRSMAYISNESGRWEVYVRPFPRPGGRVPVSSEGGFEPLWTPNGKQLFYHWQTQTWVVDVRLGAEFAAGKPRRLFDKPDTPAFVSGRCYDVTADGQRFLMMQLNPMKSQPLTDIILVQNWFEELKHLAPAARK